MKVSILSAAAMVLVSGGTAMAVQFNVLDPGYTQQIYAAPGVGAAMAWTASGHLLTRVGSTIQEYSPTQNNTVNLTNVHGVIATYNVPGLSSGGTGMTTGTDGYIYALSSTGLQRMLASNIGAGATTLVNSFSGGGYGITTLPNGNIAYSDGVGGASHVWVYDPVANTNNLIYSTTSQVGGGYLIDGMVAGPTGNLALTGQDNSTMTVITSGGTYLNSWNTSHFPDGLAFADNATQSTLYSNNNDGTISRYDLGPGFTGTPVITDIAMQTLASGKAYGDLASVGPDCAFYVSQFDQTIAGYHGSTLGTGTHWDDGSTTTDSSIVRIGGGIGADGLPVDCQFYSPIMGSVVSPEPSTLGALVMGAAALIRRRSRR